MTLKRGVEVDDVNGEQYVFSGDSGDLSDSVESLNADDRYDNRDALSSETKHIRVRTGCFSCRKRKKKCDETQPICKGCLRNRIKCKYPRQLNETLPPGFDLEETTYDGPPLKRRKSTEDHAFVNQQRVFNVMVTKPVNARKNSVNNRKRNLESVIQVKKEEVELSKTAPLKPQIESATLTLSESDTLSEDDQQLERRLSIVSPTTDKPLLSFSKHIPNLVLSPQDSQLYHHFVNNFIPSISLPHAHPLLAPNYIWVNLGQQSKILAQVYLFCGASFLSFHHGMGGNPLSLHYKQLAETKYRQILTSLSQLVDDQDIDSDWLLAAGLTLSLCDRSFAADSHRCVKHLVFVYRLVKRREERLLSSEKIEEDVGGAVVTADRGTQMKVTPNERSLLDSFAFNYSTTLFTCPQSDLINLPSPYDFFPKIKKWFKVPIYTDCDISWINNPVLGSSLESFEILSKLVWVLRFHFDEENVNDPDWYIDNRKFWSLMPPLKAQVFEARAKIDSYKVELDSSYTSAILSHNISYQDLRANLAVSTIILQCCEILCEKLMNPSVPAFFPTIQKCVNLILDEFVHNLPPSNVSNCLITLCLFVTGISTTNSEQRELFLTKMTIFSKALDFNIARNIIALLKINWEKEKEEEVFGDAGFKCFDLIFDREAVGSIVF